MFIGKDLEEDFKELVEKSIKANLTLLSETTNKHYNEKLMIISNVTNNLETISKAIK